MYEIYSRDDGTRVATVKFDPYKVEMHKPVSGVKTVLDSMRDREQWNRTSADIEPPESLVMDGSQIATSSYEGGQEPSERYLVNQITVALSDGYLVQRADRGGSDTQAERVRDVNGRAESKLIQGGRAEGATQDDIDTAVSKLDDAVNMTASELRDWSNHACSDEASLNPETVRQRVLNLLETPKSDWGDKEVDDTGQVVQFIARMRGMEQGDSSGDCPSDRDISLLNWGYRPDGVDL